MHGCCCLCVINWNIFSTAGLKINSFFFLHLTINRFRFQLVASLKMSAWLRCNHTIHIDVEARFHQVSPNFTFFLLEIRKFIHSILAYFQITIFCDTIRRGTSLFTIDIFNNDNKIVCLIKNGEELCQFSPLFVSPL